MQKMDKLIHEFPKAFHLITFDSSAARFRNTNTKEYRKKDTKGLGHRIVNKK